MLRAGKQTRKQHQLVRILRKFEKRTSNSNKEQFVFFSYGRWHIDFSKIAAHICSVVRLLSNCWNSEKDLIVWAIYEDNRTKQPTNRLLRSFLLSSLFFDLVSSYDPMQVRKNDGVYAIDLSFFWNSTESRRCVILWWYVTYLLSMIFKISWKIRLLYG